MNEEKNMAKRIYLRLLNPKTPPLTSELPELRGASGGEDLALTGFPRHSLLENKSWAFDLTDPDITT